MKRTIYGFFRIGIEQIGTFVENFTNRKGLRIQRL